MIQRIQTVYLSLAFILTLFGLFLPWVIYQVGNLVIDFSASQLGSNDISTQMLSFYTGLVSVIIGICIFLFKHRKRQLRVVRLSMLLVLLQYGVFGIEHYMNITHLQTMGELDMDYRVMVVLPLIAVILLWMGLRGIKKDEELVRSVDRLR